MRPSWSWDLSIVPLILIFAVYVIILYSRYRLGKSSKNSESNWCRSYRIKKILNLFKYFVGKAFASDSSISEIALSFLLFSSSSFYFFSASLFAIFLDAVSNFSIRVPPLLFSFEFYFSPCCLNMAINRSPEEACFLV